MVAVGGRNAPRGLGYWRGGLGLVGSGPRPQYRVLPPCGLGRGAVAGFSPRAVLLLLWPLSRVVWCARSCAVRFAPVVQFLQAGWPLRLAVPCAARCSGGSGIWCPRRSRLSLFARVLLRPSLASGAVSCVVVRPTPTCPMLPVGTEATSGPAGFSTYDLGSCEVRVI